jgi:hypothetical protein
MQKINLKAVILKCDDPREKDHAKIQCKFVDVVQ